MTRCPKCNSEITVPKKVWVMHGRQDRAGVRTELKIGLFDCPNCHKEFREVLSKDKIVGREVQSTPNSKQPSVREIIREKEVIVKIRCSYCKNLYVETLDKCPHCGGKS